VGDTISDPATLIPIIPPSRGHGYDIYTELGADRVLVYTRFDDSTKDFPVETKFAQVGILKNVSEYSDTGIGNTYTGSTYSSLYSIKFGGDFPGGDPAVGSLMQQDRTIGGIKYEAKGYVASWDKDTKVLKYYRDRSLYFPNKVDQRDAINVGVGIGTTANVVDFVSEQLVTVVGVGETSIDSSFNGTTFNGINLGVNFTAGLASPEINKKTGTIIYIDNRPEVERNLRQKEDIKIILEF